MRLRTLLGLTPIGALALASFAAAPAQAHTIPHSAPLVALNNSGVTGHVTVLQKNGEVRVNMSAHGLEAGQVHLQHIHGFINGKESHCPTPAFDTDGDGLVSFDEGLPAYGPPVIVLGADQTSTHLTYSRSFERTAQGEPVSALGPLADYTVVVHGRTVDGTYQQTLPVACAELEAPGN